jgi:hypothetical protein
MPEKIRSHLAKSRETGHSESAIRINTQQLQCAFDVSDAVLMVHIVRTHIFKNLPESGNVAHNGLRLRKPADMKRY